MTPEEVAWINGMERALERIRDMEVRSDRRHRGMVDVSIIDDAKRIARRALEEPCPDCLAAARAAHNRKEQP